MCYFYFGKIAFPGSMKGGSDGEFPEAKREIITAGSGQQRGSQTRLWAWTAERPGWSVSPLGSEQEKRRLRPSARTAKLGLLPH